MPWLWCCSARAWGRGSRSCLCASDVSTQSPKPETEAVNNKTQPVHHPCAKHAFIRDDGCVLGAVVPLMRLQARSRWVWVCVRECLDPVRLYPVMLRASICANAKAATVTPRFLRIWRVPIDIHDGSDRGRFSELRWVEWIVGRADPGLRLSWHTSCLRWMISINTPDHSHKHHLQWSIYLRVLHIMTPEGWLCHNEAPFVSCSASLALFLFCDWTGPL